jgi:7-carboxy-7-deazaguanine synthase
VAPDRDNLAVNDIYPCIQGEGVLAGTPMVLIRLHGCGVGCPWCDTKETWEAIPVHRKAYLADALGTGPFWAWASPLEIALKAQTLAARSKWALVTGGEPADQPLSGLVDALHHYGLKAAVETSGTAIGHVRAGFDHVCVSPKIGMPGGKPILKEAVAAAHEIKFVVGREADLETLERFLAEHRPCPETVVSVQPLSTQAKATAICLKYAMGRGHRLSLQLHKYLNER